MSDAEDTFKNGFARVFTESQLRALLAGCEADDARLIQGSTTRPAFGGNNPFSDRTKAACGCAVSYAGMTGGDGPTTVGDVEEFFAEACFAADQVLGNPGACRHFLNWFDDADRKYALRTLAGWCRDVLAAGHDPAPRP